MKKFFGSVAAVLAMMAAMVLGSTATASATGPDHAHCHQIESLVVICELDLDILTGSPDFDVHIEDVARVLTDNEIEVLENALKNADIIDDVTLDVDVNVLKGVIVDVFDNFDPSIDVDVTKIFVHVCALVLHC